MRRMVPFVMSVLFAAACTGAQTAPRTTGAAPAATGPTAATATAVAAPTPAHGDVTSSSYATQAPPQATATPADMSLPEAAPQGEPAPEIVSSTWINSQPLDWQSLRGKVVMVEFWTFDCINCRHVIPYLKGMDADYRKQGLTIIGVHSPEFDYEHVLANVQDAVQKMGIKYPVAIDNDFTNWNRYRNLAWPTLYLVDKHGNIRYSHVGEEGYDETRQWIEKLLKE